MNLYARCGCTVQISSVDFCGGFLLEFQTSDITRDVSPLLDSLKLIQSLRWRRETLFFPSLLQWLKLIFGFSSFSGPEFLDDRLLFAQILILVHSEKVDATHIKQTDGKDETKTKGKNRAAERAAAKKKKTISMGEMKNSPAHTHPD